MNTRQTADEARNLVYDAMVGSCEAGFSKAYINALRTHVALWLKAIDVKLAAEEEAKAVPVVVAPVLPAVRRAVRIIHNNGGKFYYNGKAWDSKPTWTLDHEQAKAWLKDAQRRAAYEIKPLIKIVHPAHINLIRSKADIDKLGCKCTTPRPDLPARYHTINCSMSFASEKG